MKVLVRYLGSWGLGDRLCSDPVILGLVERHGEGTEIWLEGKAGNVEHNPLVSGMAPPDLRPDEVVEIRLFSHMDITEYSRLEAMPSLIDHMCSYAGVDPSDRRPRLHLTAAETEHELVRAVAELPRVRVAICADHVDPLRHWPLERWQLVAAALAKCGATVIEFGTTDRLGVGVDMVGKLTVRETAAAIAECDLFLGNNSGLFHYAQAAGVPCVALFSLALPRRFVHPGASVHAIQATHLPCINCMTRCFAAMQQQGCIAAPRGRCMLEIEVGPVLEAAIAALEQHAPAPAGA